jgi:hypothetical protein
MSLQVSPWTFTAPWLQCQSLWLKKDYTAAKPTYKLHFTWSLCDLFYQSQLNLLRRSDHLIFVELSLSKMYILYVFSWLQRGDRENAEWRPESPSLRPGSLPPLTLTRLVCCTRGYPPRPLPPFPNPTRPSTVCYLGERCFSSFFN